MAGFEPETRRFIGICSAIELHARGEPMVAFSAGVAARRHPHDAKPDGRTFNIVIARRTGVATKWLLAGGVAGTPSYVLAVVAGATSADAALLTSALFAVWVPAVVGVWRDNRNVAAVRLAVD